MENIHFKIATSDEVIRLSELFSNVYKKQYSEKELQWRYLHNPIHKGDILNCIALRNNKEIIGHTAFIKQEFSINNNVYYGGLTVGSAVKNNHVGIFPSMYEYLEKSFANEFDFLYGYPNQNSAPFFIKLFKYKKVYSSILELNYNHDILFKTNKHKKIFDIITSKYRNINSDYFLWRIINNPFYKYNQYIFNKSIIVWKNYLNKSIDLVCIKNFSEDTIYSKNINFQKRGKINLLSTSKNKSNLLIGEGFTNKLTSNTFLIKTINPKVNINNIPFQMIDIDIF